MEPGGAGRCRAPAGPQTGDDAVEPTTVPPVQDSQLHSLGEVSGHQGFGGFSGDSWSFKRLRGGPSVLISGSVCPPYVISFALTLSTLNSHILMAEESKPLQEKLKTGVSNYLSIG